MTAVTADKWKAAAPGASQARLGAMEPARVACGFCGWVLREYPMCCHSARQKWELEHPTPSKPAQPRVGAFRKPDAG